jgi:hypothetical protein
MNQADHHPQSRRLAGSVGAEQAQDLSLLYCEFDVVDGMEAIA